MRPLIVLLLALGAAVAQETPGPPEVRFQRLAVGLPHPEVQALAQDRDGLVWVGTNDGLARYDGLGLVVLRRRSGDPSTLPSSTVQSLLATAEGALYVGTKSGVARLDPTRDTFQRVSPAEGACAGAVPWLAANGADRVVFGSRALGLCRLDAVAGRVDRVRTPWSGRGGGERTWAFAGMPDGAVWAVGAEPDDLCRIEPGGGPCERVETGGFQPRLLGHDAEGRLLAVGRAAPEAGLELRRRGRDRFLPVARDLPDFGWGEGATVRAVGREAWVTTATGGVLAVHLDTGDWRWLRPVPGDPTSLPAARVGAVLLDRQGGAWVGTSSGLAVWRPPVRPFTLYRRFTGRPGEISDDRVNGMAEDRDGALWVATNDGLNRLDPASGQFETFRVPDSQRGGPPAYAPEPSDPYRDAWWQVLPASDGVLWVGGKRNGLFRLDARTGRYSRETEVSDALGLTTTGDEPRGFGVRHIYEDAAGRIWVGTTGEGLAVREPGTGDWRAVRPAEGDSTLPHPSVNRFSEDAAGRLWVGTDAGVARVRQRGGRMTFDPLDLGTEAVPVWSLGESPATPGDLWVGTVGAGLVRVSPETGETTRYTTEEGMPSDLVYGVLSDDDGDVWASTSRGLARLDPATGAIAVYDDAHGLQGDAFDLMAFYRSPTTGDLWFGGPNGLNRIDPEGAGVATYRPPVAFTAVQVNDETRPGRPASGSTLTFDHDENFLTVQFAALDFTAPRALRYRYRLVGVDDGWRETTGERPFATYTDLDPGTYQLEVLGANADGVFNDDPATLTLVVRPAWWQRTPVRLLGLGALGALAAFGIGLLLARAARQYRAERQALADDLQAGPIRHTARLGEDLRAFDAGDGASERLVKMQKRASKVERGLHEALLRLAPSSVGDRLSLGRALVVTVGRFRRAAPDTQIRLDGDVPDGLPPDVQQDVVEVATRLVGHALRATDPDAVALTVTEAEGAVEVRVATDGSGPIHAPALRDRLMGRASGMAHVLRVVRARAGSLTVDRDGAGSAVVVRLPLPEAVGRQR